MKPTCRQLQADSDSLGWHGHCMSIGTSMPETICPHRKSARASARLSFSASRSSSHRPWHLQEIAFLDQDV
eukprot:5227703-Amphidinium_carterae.1